MFSLLTSAKGQSAPKTIRSQSVNILYEALRGDDGINRLHAQAQIRGSRSAERGAAKEHLVKKSAFSLRPFIRRRLAGYAAESSIWLHCTMEGFARPRLASSDQIGGVCTGFRVRRPDGCRSLSSLSRFVKGPLAKFRLFISVPRCYASYSEGADPVHALSETHT